MRAILVSGGGARGSYGFGQIQDLFAKGKKYTLLIGDSTGAFLATMAACNRLDILEQVYLHSNNKDIWKVNPFNKKGGIRILNAIWRGITGKQSIGDMTPLKNLIDKYFTEDIWDSLQASGKEVLIGASDMDRQDFNVKYFSSKEEDFETFKNILLASASPPIISQPVVIDGIQYVDAGTREIISFNKAIEKGATYIDCIIHRTKTDFTNKLPQVKWWVKILFRTWNSALNAGPVDIIHAGIETCRLKGIVLEDRWMPYEPSFGPFWFDSKEMQDLYYKTK